MSFTNQKLESRNLPIIDCNDFEIPAFKNHGGREKIYSYPFKPKRASITIDKTEMVIINNFNGKVIDRIYKYEDITRRGYKILSIPTRDKWRRKRQRVKFILCPIMETVVGSNHYKSIPNGHAVELHLKKNAIRIRGPNTGQRGVGPWMPILAVKR